MATGNVAALHGLNTGVIAVGREADLLVVDAPQGSQADRRSGGAGHWRHPGGGDRDHRR